MEKLVLQKYFDYSSNLNLISGQITKEGTLILIESDLQELDFFHRPVPKRNWTIQIIKSDSVETVELKNVPLLPTGVDLFSDGTLLIVQGRCLKDGKYIERNARRYNPNGQLIEAFTLGDGIEHVQIDDNDTIWVSYFDEGVFGNFGWEQPMGSEGLVAYNINGHKLWGAGSFGIVDCYALNVASSKEVYFYYYADSFLVQLNEMKETIRYRIEGDTINQFIFDKTSLIGQVDMNTIMRFRKNNRTITPKEKLQLIDENGKPIIGPVFMRGTFLYAYGKDGIYIKRL
ncbi:hypothetical protein BKP45_10045 [Anaerobacillus alkalidiazotrophicus]|uniref:Uncharacterized protein n=1 Tax=Anaerobacillus alkalidiazotrophicus TaxID=472963 RepID=A0A1S2M8M3_9BACI|nr:hypothetical protein BKP45_10045 [Anaerobacillus alkalidiazotrophicus]